ncbi:glycosyltransferase family 4 protein [Marivibrio halodurans]|uniref:Glycosyltransferase family 4 protein n=1 Tax=Marivibrio halodurans TaxID=2039722 RepID=A0A8J7S0J8_9PROT|nr:glycosyltransferase family 4 protein [Marivibrio halodurans]MBP5858122.1 glycosyltransferase family 4 protein [Marivibrio halodurans]
MPRSTSPPVAFHAPMKPPDDPRPSGDRRMARALMEGLSRAGYSPFLASSFKSRDGAGDPAAQTRLIETAEVEAARLIDRLRADPPACWLTYHCYYKAPDLLGPRVAAALGIPYVLVEASHAPGRRDGPHAVFARAAEDAIRAADLILQPNPDDPPAVAPLLKPGARQEALPPFIDTEPFRSADRAAARARLAAAHGLDPAACWCVTAAMMRPGAKSRSYAVLAAALRTLTPDAGRWHLIAAGDGPARAEVAAMFTDLPESRLLSMVGVEAVADLFAAGDIFVWPAVSEAFGFALIEAQTAGLPAIVGDRPGPRSLVRAGETALLAPEGDAGAFAAALRQLVSNPDRRLAMGRAARDHADRRHGMAAGADHLRRALDGLTGRVSGRVQP